MSLRIIQNNDATDVFAHTNSALKFMRFITSEKTTKREIVVSASTGFDEVAKGDIESRHDAFSAVLRDYKDDLQARGVVSVEYHPNSDSTASSIKSMIEKYLATEHV